MPIDADTQKALDTANATLLSLSEELKALKAKPGVTPEEIQALKDDLKAAKEEVAALKKGTPKTVADPEQDPDADLAGFWK